MNRQSTALAEDARQDAYANTRPLRVLTLTPFYPSIANPVQGCFVSEPLQYTGSHCIQNQVIAVAPFYRPKPHACDSNTEISWAQYGCIPGNLGLASAGVFLSRTLHANIADAHRYKSIDLIHAHAALPCGHAAARLSAHLNIPFVVSVHGLDVFADNQSGKLLGKWTKQVATKVYESAARIICISERVRDRLPSNVQHKAAVVYNGADAHTFFPVAGPDQPATTVLSVGNLIPIKDHASLLRAFAALAAEFPTVKLEIIGEGPERENLIRLANQLGVRPRVQFLGRKSRKEVADAMRACSVFALPSRYEGLGCVYLEAMACGKPVVACRGQGIEEIVEHGNNGLLISPDNVAELTEILQRLLQSQLLRTRLGAAAQRTIVQRCTLEHQAAELANIYRECAA